jgi:hypothetical protein
MLAFWGSLSTDMLGAILEWARGALTIKDKQDSNEDIAAPKHQDNT